MRSVRATTVPWHCIAGHSDLSLAIALCAFLAAVMPQGPWKKADVQGIPISLREPPLQVGTFQSNVLHLRVRHDRQVDIRAGIAPNHLTVPFDHLRTYLALEQAYNLDVGASLIIDPSVRYGDVIQVLDQLLQLGVEKILLNGPPPGHQWWSHMDVQPGIQWMDPPPIHPYILRELPWLK